MKRAHNRMLRHSAEMGPVAPHNADYTGRHESIAEIFADVAELFAEVCNDLAITAEFIAETVAENTARIRKIAEKYLRNIRIPMPEFHPARWKYSGHFDAGIFDLPIIAEGGGKYDVAWNWRG